MSRRKARNLKHEIPNKPKTPMTKSQNAEPSRFLSLVFWISNLFGISDLRFRSFRPWLLAGMISLLVARSLYPSESAASQGDGLPMVMLWLSLAVIWLTGAIGSPRFRLRFGPVDAAVLALVAWQCIAAVHAVQYGSPRPAWNMLWEWVGLGMVFFLARQLIDDAREARAVVAAMIALMAAISVYGIYQRAIELPALQGQYAADPEGMLRENGLNYPPGTPLRDLLERRLANREPPGTFALTNSLAAALAPWLVVGLGTAAAAWRHRGRWIGWLVCLVPIAVCLLLTKSRSGYAAAAVGIGWLALCSRHTPCAVRPAAPVARFFLGNCRLLAVGTRRVPATGKRWLAAAVLVAGFAAVAVFSAGFGKSAATTSFGYRVQYWQATLQMIADRPWFGCGPGNFQDVYTQYKLPDASEEVADPHNFLLEVWATAGTPAVLALLGVLGLFWVRRSPSPSGRGSGRGELAFPIGSGRHRPEQAAQFRRTLNASMPELRKLVPAYMASSA